MDRTPIPTVTELLRAAGHPAPGDSAIAEPDEYQIIQTDGGLAVLNHRTRQFIVVQGPAAGSIPAAAPAPEKTGLGRTEKRVIVYTACGTTLMLGAGGAFALFGHGLAEGAVGIAAAAGFVKWLCGLVACLVVGLVVILGKQALSGPPAPKKVVNNYRTESHGLFSRATTNTRSKQ